MQNLFLGMAVFFLVACAAEPTVKDPDPFTSYAMEWRGAQIEEMIKVWGAPRELQQYSPEGGAGTATWRTFAGGDEERSRCQATAWFDAEGTITFVETISQFCVPQRGSPYFRNMEMLKRYPDRAPPGLVE